MTDNLMEGLDNLPPETDPNKNYLEDLVGDGKKFKSPEELARGKFESDTYIKILEKRLDEYRDDILSLRKENVTNKRLEDLVNQLSNKSPNSETPQQKE